MGFLLILMRPISYLLSLVMCYRSLFGRQDEHPPFIGRIRGYLGRFTNEQCFYDDYSEED